MHTKLFLYLLLTASICLGQMATHSGRRSGVRSEFINKSGKKNTLDGVYTTGKLNILPPCTNLIVNHITSRGVAPVAKTITYNLAYSTITGENKCWLLQNLGSTNAPLSSTDNTEAASGWYWQFGSKIGYRYTASRTPSTTWPNRTLLNADWSAAQDPCTIELGTGWRLPTYAEWRTIAINYRYEANVFGSDIKLHNAGWLRQSDGLIQERGITTHYWSSTSDTDINARGFVIPSAGAPTTASTNDKDAGFSVRCIRD
ncbi:hypothetical protein [Aquirufa echingensis]|uniref:Fibrobacter succinogenes major paralogous domain-containing protein n=1 Tax=Aquirufa echingensis TaxID=3096516 RepID=A0ABW6CWA5_9BACT